MRPRSQGPDSDAFFRLYDLSGVWRDDKSPTGPQGALGPEYRVGLVWGDPASPTATNEYLIYPYAEGGPVTFVPDQAISMDTPGVVPGWFGTSSVLVTYLRDLGVPEAPVAVAAGPASIAAALRSTPWGWIFGAFALTLLLLAGVLVARPSRRSRVVA